MTLPDSEGGWTWESWTEWDAMMTDPEIGAYGTLAPNDFASQYMPQMYSNGVAKPFNDRLTRTMFDLPEAGEAWEYMTGKIFEHKASPPAGLIRELSGEYSDPFTAGKIGIWPSDRASSTGFATPQIKNRFAWTLLPEVIAARGGPPGHTWREHANLATIQAEREGVIEGSTSLAVYLAGEEFQCRVGIDRGHMSVQRAELGSPASVAPPPEGMKWLKVYADRPTNRGLFPFRTWRDWYEKHRELARMAWTGQQTPAKSLEACQAWGFEHFSTYEGPRPFVAEPVYP
ncbi:MAG: hypothetical protein OXG65_06465 [Chloroflexi bacterium]|nr:hypothetical protein [Chloroflexota bacterium]